MREPVVVHPLGLSIVRAYLLTCPEVTDIVDDRIAAFMPGDTITRWPAIRLTEVTSLEIVSRRWMRTNVQVDCWGQAVPSPGIDRVGADRLARAVVGALRASANHVEPGAVMGETTDLSTRPDPDESITPTHGRTIVTGNVWVRPNP